MFDTNSTLEDNDTSTIVSNDIISNNVKFWVYFIFLIPSLICSLIFFGYFIFNRTTRKCLHNHVILIVIFISFLYETILYPWMLYYFRYEGIWSRSKIFCTIWAFLDWGVYYTQTILVAWACFERHILIFHDRWISNKRKRLFVHYFPLIILCVYCLIFYIIVSFFPSCENEIDNSYMVCASLCFANNYALYMWDTIVHQTLPNLLIGIFSISLVARVLYQKHRIYRSIQWRQTRKMTIQLVSIAVLYLVYAFPMALMNLMYLCGLSANVGVQVYDYFTFTNYLMLLFLPFISLFSLGEFQKDIKHLLRIRNSRRIIPSTVRIVNHN